MTENDKIDAVVVRAYIQCNDEVLLLKRLDDVSKHPGNYELPGGKLDSGEDLDQALFRELKEETGKEIRQIDSQNQISFMYYNYGLSVVSVNFYIKIDSKFAPILASSEHQTFEWVKSESVKNYNISPELKKYIEIIQPMNVEEKTTPVTEVKLYTDGGSRGNPGPSALGYVIYDLEENVVKKGSKYLGITTNNQAEYQAVKVGLQDCLNIGCSKVDVFLDSQLVANQMNGIYKIKNRELWPIHEAINSLSTKFRGGVKFTYIPRELNKEADAMVNLELDNYMSGNK